MGGEIARMNMKKWTALFAALALALCVLAGCDPDAAARRVFVTWNGVFGGLPRDGQYAASIAMIEAENGYYIAVDVNVVKAGAQHDDSDDEPEEPYTKNTDGSYTINTPDGLGKLLDKIGKDAIATAHIKLESDVTLPASWPDDIAFSGILDGNGKTITIGGRTQGLFEEITSDNSKSRSGETTGTVKNLHVLVTGNISGNVYSGYAGAVAGVNKGEITNCHVTIETDGSISASGGEQTNHAGSVVGYNNGTVDDYTVEDSNDPKLPEIGN